MLYRHKAFPQHESFHPGVSSCRRHDVQEATIGSRYTVPVLHRFSIVTVIKSAAPPLYLPGSSLLEERSFWITDMNDTDMF
jgi:hypothetical protein